MVVKFFGVLVSIGSATAGIACCCVAEQGAAVRFVGQTNIVIWDKAHGIEHFVRDARFATTSKDLGFIAPTPSRPTLSEASIAAFELLADFDPASPAASTAGAMKAGDFGGVPVDVIEEKDVAGYRATVLRATDSKALGAWLSKNGYPKPKFLDGWVKPYLDRGWYLTAFKVKGGQTAATGPVRMSFATNRPFNPYSVPKENGNGGASLRLYYVSAGNEKPKIGGVTPWQKAKWSAPLGECGVRDLAEYLKLPSGAIPGNASVMAYEDNDFGRSGLDDLYLVEESRADLVGGLGLGAVLVVLAIGSRGRMRKASKSGIPNS